MRREEFEKTMIDILEAVRDKEKNVFAAKDEIMSLLSNDHEVKIETVQKKIKRTMDDIEVPPRKAVYKYIYSAMVFIYENPNQMLEGGNKIYRSVSEMHKVSERAVYQAIWQFIYDSWYKGKGTDKKISKLFNIRKKIAPSNTEFFRAFYEYIKE